MSCLLSTDDDLFDPSLIIDSEFNYPKPTFSSFVDNAEEIREIIEKTLNTDNSDKIPLTWFIRCDDEINFHYGDPLFLVKKKYAFITNEINLGSQIGYHPHLYRIGGDGARFRDISDAELCDQFELNASKFYNFFDSNEKIVRIGEAFSCDKLSKSIEKLSFRADASAMPGRYRQDSFRSLDWRGTPYKPYFPCCNDYRRAAGPGESHYSFVEIPFTMLKLKCPYDSNPFARYVDFSFHSDLVMQQLRELNLDNKYLMVMTHPSGIFPKYQMRNHGLSGFGQENYRQNLINLKEFADKNNISLCFKTVSDIADEVS